MKKLLLFASAFALLTGCSKTEHAPEAPIIQKVDGIAFHASLDADTKGELYQDEVTKAWRARWYAEADKMDVYYANIVDPTKPEATWDATTKQTYKATRTLGEGYFAAEATPIDFTPDQNLSFRFVYPTGTTVAKVGDDLVATLPAIKTQTQSPSAGVNASVANFFMVGKKDNVAPENGNNPAVADVLVDMQLTRPFPVGYFKLKNYDADLYGELQSIKLKSLGTIIDPSALPINYTGPSYLDYGSVATYNLETDEFAIHDASKGHELTVNVNAPWEDGKPVFMAMNVVDRSKNTKAEWVEITYTFEKATFTKKLPLGVNASFEAHKLYDMSNGGFDLAAQPYVVLGTTNATLLLNKSFDASIESIVDQAGKINGVALADISQLVSNVVLSQNDLKYLGSKFTALAEVALLENTEIPAFDIKDQVLTKLAAPKVTSIDEKAFNATAGGKLNLTHCLLPSYDFKKVSIAASLLKSTYLTHLDISAVEKIATTFPATGLSLQNYTLLEEVTVKPGVEVGTKAFDGCVKLAVVDFPEGTVNGSLNLIGEYAFAGCAEIEEVSISNTKIPAGAFKDCALLELVTFAGEDIVPTAIGADAFKGTAIANMDLSQATEIGASAFEGCTALVGVKNETSGVNVLSVDAITELKDNTFKGCTALTYIGFKNVEKVGNQFLAGTTCKEISFSKKIASTTIAANSFGTTTDTVLYVAADQPGVSDATITFVVDNKNTKVSFIFKAIKN